MLEPMRWLLRGFVGRRASTRAPSSTPATSTRCCRRPTASRARPSRRARRRRRPPELGLGTLPAPRALPVSRLSYSGLEDYRRCSYRFYLERALRLPPVESPSAAEAAPPSAGLGALLRGTLVHELLERLDFRRPAVPAEEDVAALIEAHSAAVTAEEVADLRDMVERFLASDLCDADRAARAGAHRAAVRLPARRPRRGGRSLLVNGVVDVHADEGDRLLVVDYKSDAAGRPRPRPS